MLRAAHVLPESKSRQEFLEGILTQLEYDSAAHNVQQNPSPPTQITEQQSKKNISRKFEVLKKQLKGHKARVERAYEILRGQQKLQQRLGKEIQAFDSLKEQLEKEITQAKAQHTAFEPKPKLKPLQGIIDYLDKHLADEIGIFDPYFDFEFVIKLNEFYQLQLALESEIAQLQLALESRIAQLQLALESEIAQLQLQLALESEIAQLRPALESKIAQLQLALESKIAAERRNWLGINQELRLWATEMPLVDCHLTFAIGKFRAVHKKEEEIKAALAEMKKQIKDLKKPIVAPSPASTPEALFSSNGAATATATPASTQGGVIPKSINDKVTSSFGVIM